jgi:methionine-rich copper-binding protein CopC
MFRITASALMLLTSLASAPTSLAAVDPGEEMDYSFEFRANVTLTFDTLVDANRSSVEIFGPNGRVSIGTPTRGADRSELLIPLRNDLPPGTYVVHFNAYAVTGEVMTGSTAVAVPYRHAP